jgi:hypothetical protein
MARRSSAQKKVLFGLLFHKPNFCVYLPHLFILTRDALSTSCLNSSFGITRALCNQVAQSRGCLSLLASFDDESRLAFVEYLELRTSEREAFLRLVRINRKRKCSAFGR